MTKEMKIYRSEDLHVQLDVLVENETVWLSQAQMVALFQRDVSVISRHIQNVFREGELIKEGNLHFLQIANSDKPGVLAQMTKRAEGVRAIVCVNKISETLRLDVNRHNRQYPLVEMCEVPAIHDRFLLIDDARLYTFGASVKDLGKKLFCFNLMEEAEVVSAVRKMILRFHV